MAEFIRPIQSADIAQIAEIERLCFAMPWSEESIRKDVEENVVACWLVMDDGEGISQDVYPHLFTDYFDSNRRSYSHEKRNMGIGLSVCQTIIKAHGGIIYAQNREPHGAEFTFTLPL